MPSVRRDCSPPARSGRRAVSPRGFTLIELLFVMSIIAVLVGFTVVGIIGAQQRAAIARAKSELALLAQALEAYRRHFGDYPQTGAAAQANSTVTATIGATQAQALLFNALTGVYAPTNFALRVNGPIFVDVSKFALEVALNTSTFGIAVGAPPAKQPIPNAFLDSWGHRYLYYYKRATPPPANGLPVASTWLAPAYVLYSAGPDGAQTPPNITTGLYTGTTQTSGTNADNLFADKLP